MHRVFVDGSTGTTGLDIITRLRARSDLELITLDESDRRDMNARIDAIHAADVSVLCLPDDAVQALVSALGNSDARLLDASSRHRTDAGWAYGLPELCEGQRARIASSTRVSNPGCYPTGFLLTVRPLVDAGLIDKKAELTMHAVSGYSGGGKQMIARYEAAAHNLAARPYALALNHKHLPEMRVHAGLDRAPLFSPMVSNYYKGMITQVPLCASASQQQVHQLLHERYSDEPFVHVHPLDDTTCLDQGALPADGANNTNRIDLFVFGDDAHVLLTARFDNLGKGACGAAMQNLNLMLGIDECTGLHR